MAFDISFATASYKGEGLVATACSTGKRHIAMPDSESIRTVFGTSEFFAPGGAMNLYLGGVIGMAWVVGVIYWGFTRAGQAPDLPS